MLTLVNTPSYISKLPVRVSVQAVRDRTYVHFHRHIQLCFLLSGELRHIINGTEYIQQPGSCAFLLPCVPHSLSTVESEDTPLLAHIWFEQDFLTSRGYDFFAFGKETKHFGGKEIPDVADFEGKSEEAKRIIRETIYEFDRKEEMSYDKIASLVAGLFALACSREKKVKITAPFRRQTERVLCASKYIEDNFREKLTLDELCDVAGTSRRSFTSHFRRITGMSPNEYLISARLAAAANLIIASERLHDDIAKECGLYNSSNLARVFVKYLGVTPSKYSQRVADASRSAYQVSKRSRYSWLEEM